MGKYAHGEHKKRRPMTKRERRLWDEFAKNPEAYIIKRNKREGISHKKLKQHVKKCSVCGGMGCAFCGFTGRRII